MIPQGTRIIDNEAFSDCSGLTSVTIPEGVTNIGYDAFHFATAGITITVPRNSYAEQYCEKNKLNYQYPDSLDWLND